jgi:hypothetical protein
MNIMTVILGIAVALSLVLASPTGNFMFVALTLGSGLFFMIGIGYWAFLGPIAIALTALTSFLKFTSWRVFRFAIVLWVSAAIVHVGQSHGLSRWGDAASTMGGKNQPYSTIFWTPVVTIRAWLTEPRR